MAFPNCFGTMRAMLYLALVKCATPVNKNIAASAQRAEATQAENAAKPKAPAARKISSAPTRTTITITMKIVTALGRNLQSCGFQHQHAARRNLNLPGASQTQVRNRTIHDTREVLTCSGSHC